MISHGNFTRIAHVAGEGFDADQLEWRCEECGKDEYCCGCEPEPTCDCGELLDARGWCWACDKYERPYGDAGGLTDFKISIDSDGTAHLEEQAK